MYKIAYLPLLVNGNLIPFFGFGLGYHLNRKLLLEKNY
jgi:hypothetical protein